jgi:hypothetical protein
MNKKTYIDKDTITALGWKVTTDSRYRLDEHKRKLLDQYNTNRGVLEACENVGVNVQNVPLLWLKSKNESVSIRNPYYKPTGEEKLSEEIIIEELAKKIIPIKTNKNVLSEKTLVLLIGDSHIGLHISNEAPLTNKVLDFGESLQKTLKLIDQSFEEVVVVFGGDITDSVNNLTARGQHHLPSSMTTREMFEKFISDSKSYFTSLAENPLIGKIRFVSVSEDNHTSSNCGIYSRALEIWLNAQFPDIETNVFFKVQELITIKDHKLLILHGKDGKHQFKGHPLSLNPKTESFFTNWFLTKNIVPNYKNTHVIKFDLHQSSYQLSNFFSYMNCLSFQAGSEWQQSNFGGSQPGCNYLIISNTGISRGEFYI